jgi:thymidylate synthase
MINIEEQYLSLLSGVYHCGKQKKDRTGHGTISRFGGMIEHDMALGFPLITTKKMSFNLVKSELLWILNGRTDMQYLWDNNVKYWDHDYIRSGRTDGTLGPVYGKQWRDFNGVDQLYNLLYTIMHNPSSRRMIVNAWNPAEMDDMVLPPCHYSFQVNINDGKLDLIWQQRSVDLFLGLPYDIAMYGLLLSMLADFAMLRPGKLIGQFGDCHIYNNHLEAVEKQLKRQMQPLPSLHLKRKLQLIDNSVAIPEKDSIILKDYNPLSAIKAEFPNELN